MQTTEEEDKLACDIIASTPFNATHKCKVFGKFSVVSHIKEHRNMEDWNMMIKDITIIEDSIIGLAGIEKAVNLKEYVHSEY